MVSLLSDPELLLSAWQEQHQIDKKTNLSEEELRRLKHQVSDGKSQCRRLVDAYQKQAIELEELVSRRTAIEQRLESIQRIIDELAAEPDQGLSFADLERSIDEVCRSLSGRLQGMDMNARMSICRHLIDKVVVDNYNVEIHYKFPVSGNTNTKRERPPLQLQGLPFASFLLPEAQPAVRRGCEQTAPASPPQGGSRLRSKRREARSRGRGMRKPHLVRLAPEGWKQQHSQHCALRVGGASEDCTDQSVCARQSRTAPWTTAVPHGT